MSLKTIDTLLRSLMKWSGCLQGAAWMVAGLVLIVMGVSGASEAAGAPAMLSPVLGAGALLYGSLMFTRAWRQVQLAERLLVEGLPADATITAIERTRDVRINNVPARVIKYRYQDHNGRAQSGESGPLSPEEAEGWEAGATGTIRFDPHNPHLSTWIGRPGSAERPDAARGGASNGGIGSDGSNQDAPASKR